MTSVSVLLGCENALSFRGLFRAFIVLIYLLDFTYLWSWRDICFNVKRRCRITHDDYRNVLHVFVQLSPLDVCMLVNQRTRRLLSPTSWFFGLDAWSSSFLVVDATECAMAIDVCMGRSPSALLAVTFCSSEFVGLCAL